MSSNKNFVPKKKSPVIKTLQWLGVSAVSILLIIYFLVVDTRGSQKTPTIGSVNGKPIYYTSTSPYGRAFRQIEGYYQQLGIQINNEMYTYIEDLAFRRAVTTILLNDVARKNINSTSSGRLEYHTIGTKEVYIAPLSVKWGQNKLTIIQHGDAVCGNGKTVREAKFVCHPNEKRLLETTGQAKNDKPFSFLLEKVN